VHIYLGNDSPSWILIHYDEISIYYDKSQLFPEHHVAGHFFYQLVPESANVFALVFSLP